MRVEIIGPDWIETGSVTLKLAELNPHATEALIETLRDSLPADDDRVMLLIDLWEALTGE